MAPRNAVCAIPVALIQLASSYILPNPFQPSTVKRWAPPDNTFVPSRASFYHAHFLRFSETKTSRLFFFDRSNEKDDASVGSKTTNPFFFRQHEESETKTSEETSTKSDLDTEPQPKSFIQEIIAHNLAGVTAATHPEDGSSTNKIDSTVQINLDPHLVAVTGETGSGKSLLLGTAAKLAVGGKASASLLSLSGEETRVQLVVQLCSPHLEHVQSVLEKAGVSPEILYEEGNKHETTQPLAVLRLSRILSLEAPQKSPRDTSEKSNSQRLRIKSTCTINDHPVNLSTLRSIGQPILTTVDASAASSALSRLSSRMAIVDCAVPSAVLTNVRRARNAYRSCRRLRENLEAELDQRILPPSYPGRSGDEDDEKILRHWVEELDDFEEQMELLKERATSALLHSTTGKEKKKNKSVGRPSKQGRIGAKDLPSAARDFASCEWGFTHEFGKSQTSDSTDFFSNLLDFRDAVKSLDEQLDHARAAGEVLTSLSSPDSALVAVEKVRSYLFDIGGSAEGPSSLADAVEQSHDLLNAVEVALAQCSKSIEGEGGGDALLEVLQSQREEVDLAPEEIEGAISDWNTLARKHGVSPYALTACHASLRSELDGNAQAKARLPQAKREEEEALETFVEACGILTDARESVAHRLSAGVSSWLPQLGMGGSQFCVALRRRGDANSIKDDISSSSISSSVLNGPILGLDTVDFMLLNRKPTKKSGKKKQKEDDFTVPATSYQGEDEEKDDGWGKVDAVASSGERARILLAVETVMPGSVGASCGSRDVNSDASVPPVTVLYDEIDAHVGGRAAVAVARLLADQGNNRNGGQVISITHSASVAAVADQHIVVHKMPPLVADEESSIGDSETDAIGERGKNEPRSLPGILRMSVRTVQGTQRRRELARMASGDVATKEAEIFADALIREGRQRREESYVKR